MINISHASARNSTHIFVLKQFCSSKEQRSALLRAKVLANVEKVDNPREESSALAWADGRVIEDAGFLDDCGFVIVVRAEAALLLFFGHVGHGKRWRQLEPDVALSAGSLLTFVWLVQHPLT